MENEKKYAVINIVLASDAAVGKTAFIYRLSYENYKDYMENDKHLFATIGCDFIFLKLKYKDINIKFIIWDTEWINSARFYNNSNLFKKADIVFLFYDSSSEFALDAFKDKKNFFKEVCKRNAIFALIRNKYDINRRIEISDEEALEFADENNMLFFHLSLHEKNETGVKELFETVLNEYFKRKREK